MIEKVLIDSIKEVLPDLEIKNLLLDKSFSENSIDSLDTMSIFLELKELGIDLTDEEIVKYCETIQSTSDLIKRKKN